MNPSGTTSAMLICWLAASACGSGGSTQATPPAEDPRSSIFGFDLRSDPSSPDYDPRLNPDSPKYDPKVMQEYLKSTQQEREASQKAAAKLILDDYKAKLLEMKRANLRKFIQSLPYDTELSAAVVNRGISLDLGDEVVATNEQAAIETLILVGRKGRSDLWDYFKKEGAWKDRLEAAERNSQSVKPR
jgi:hypothetical protein